MENTESSEHILENEIDETINDAEDIESQPRAKRGKGLVYDHLCNFESFETISEEIKNGKIGHNQWIFCGLKNTQNGDKYWYDCSCVLAVATDLPIESNRKRGAPKKNVSCLQRQKNETNASNEPAKGIESDNEDDESEIAPQPSKRIRVDETKKYCRVCNSEVRMKRNLYCPNKCKQN
ncbi:hypothetical protein BpHYR1_053303 [Brachionus plicatilis]|uniref:Uncharacterized protein n=1 Tax=Brachionus plicatilis TaxID=10195 RepID=A0A3M7T4B6_BRAPC|nr:hypothetical protein BpHYR1_053303 [Brachionus plicatilis]